ncbi:hypothetical protein WN943_029061 [Citrus x changshan-huyou]
MFTILKNQRTPPRDPAMGQRYLSTSSRISTTGSSNEHTHFIKKSRTA